MKKLFFILAIGFCQLIVINCFAQAPNAIPYQGVARNAAGNIIASQPVSLRVSIHDGTAAGTVVYSETHNAVTTPLGLFNVNIGNGTIVNGTLAGVNWGSGAKFLQVEMDAAGGTNYDDMGTTQLNSVPYALFAGGSNDWQRSGNDIYNSNTGNVGIGTTTPGAKLHVVGGDANINGVTISPTNGCNSIAIGQGALQANTSCENVAIGVFAAIGVDGPGNTVVGRVALGGNGISSSSSYNSAVGYSALGYSSGSNNTGIGNGAGNGINGAGIVTGNNNTFLGAGTYADIPAISNATAIGANTIVSQENSLILGNNANVGIGTSTPGSKLHVVGNIKMEDGNQAAGKVLTSDANGLASWQSASGLQGPAGPVGPPGPQGIQGLAGVLSNGMTEGNTPYWNGSSWVTDNSNIYNAGSNIGIGTTSPQAKLHVVNNSGSGIVHSAQGVDVGTYIDNNVAWVGTNNHQLNLNTNPGVEQMTLLPNGNIGIGTTTPENRLSVSGKANISTTLDILQGLAIGSGYYNIITPPLNSAIIEGNLGIGTSNPGAKLEVSGQVKITGGSPGSGKVLTSDAGGLASWQPASNAGLSPGTAAGNTTYWNGSAWLTDNSNIYNDGGNVGIGTNTPANKLDVEGGIAVGANYSGTSASPANGAIIEGNVGVGTSTVVNKLDVEGGIAIGATYSGTSTAPANGAIIQGNVGIGTSTPGQKLTIGGATTVFGVDNSADFVAKNSSGVYEQWLIPRFSNNRTYFTYGTGGMSIRNNSWAITTMSLSDNGNVGIGTTAPAYKLDVAGDGRILNTSIGTDGIEVNATASGNRYAYIDLHTDDTYTDYSLRFLREPGANGDSYVDHRGSGSFFIRNSEAAPMIFLTSAAERMRINASGNISIGTSTAATGYKLTVAGKVICTELKVQLQPFPDYVFEKNYYLRPLAEVEKHINSYKRLPGMPSACEVEADGMSVGEMQGKVLEKVEELTLYIIQQQKEIEALKLQLANLKN